MTATPAWTDIIVRLLACAAALVGCGLLAGADTPVIAVVCAVTAVVCCLAAVRYDAFVGLAIGVVGATVLVVVRMLTGGWGEVSPVLVIAQSVALVALGWLAGRLGGRLRVVLEAWSAESRRSVVAVHNSLGLLGLEQATSRLDEEIARSRAAHTPLCLLLVRIDLEDESLSPDSRVAVQRAVARIVESGVADYDVPFAMSENEIGAIMPGSSDDQAWRIVLPLIDRLTRVTFADRETGQRRRAVDCGQITTGLAFAHDASTSDTLVAQARHALDGRVGAAS